jgi:hypothetical protein
MWPDGRKCSPRGVNKENVMVSSKCLFGWVKCNLRLNVLSISSLFLFLSLLAGNTVASATQVATPTFSPGEEGLYAPQTVTISDTTSGATIYYTVSYALTGTTPTTASTKYT